MRNWSSCRRVGTRTGSRPGLQVLARAGAAENGLGKRDLVAEDDDGDAQDEGGRDIRDADLARDDVLLAKLLGQPMGLAELEVVGGVELAAADAEVVPERVDARDEDYAVL